MRKYFALPLIIIFRSLIYDNVDNVTMSTKLKYHCCGEILVTEEKNKDLEM